MNGDPISIDANLRGFLEEVRAGQSLALAAWAAQVLRRESLTMPELERCFRLGFEG